MGTVLGISVWVIAAYHALAKRQTAVRSAYAAIDEQLKHRYDLVPSLVDTVLRGLDQERLALETVVQARTSALNARSVAAAHSSDPASIRSLADADAALSDAVEGLLALARTRPDIQDREHLAEVAAELAVSELTIARARERYNAAVIDYNDSIARFPAALIASTFTFGAAPVLEMRRKKPTPAPADVAYS